ncbi:hypothetical protein JY572_38160 [Myxococcus landrumensis]|uniref:LexA repressor DNA-binding domain-containing protein n=1 Tax=Myxococcus landrumensis TaxID=2813577 RepID=A0ABX7N8V5_9BACT|nr:hypothetical protein JY572_38160 [Myxococcus landrumus]
MRQLEVLGWIITLTATKGFPPSIRELGDKLGIKSTNGVNDHLKALASRGLLERTKATSRGLVATVAGKSAWYTHRGARKGVSP